MKKYVDIVDPIHHFVRVYDTELPIVESAEFQRLRRIRQLSGAHLVYPSAQHTRFEHSLGVMHIAGEAGRALERKGYVDSDKVQLLRLSALVHDIGHGPFSHLFEEISPDTASHEDIGREMILESELGDELDKAGFDRRKVVDVAFGQSRHQYMNEIISGPLSADMMDYLPRDGYFTGAEHARIDYKRLTQSFEVHKGRLALERSVIHSFESMMHSRYQMFRAVYFHKTVRAAEVILLESLRQAEPTFGFTDKRTVHNFVDLTDEQVLLFLMQEESPAPWRSKTLAEYYRDRFLPKCMFERVLTGPGVRKAARTAELRARIAKKVGVEEKYIFVDSSVTPSIPLTPSKDEPTSVVLVPGGGGRGAEELPISKLPVVSAMAGFMNILRVYAYAHRVDRKKVEIAAGSVLRRI